MKKYDIIIIGAGHNGMTAGTYLSEKGHKVLLVEKRDIVGGLAASEEFFPGYRTAGLLHDPALVRSEITEKLSLKGWPSSQENHNYPSALLSGDGRHVFQYSDRSKTVESISKHSTKDARAFEKYSEFLDKIGRFIRPLFSEMPPDLINLGPAQLIALGKKAIGLRKLGKQTMMELMKVAPMSVADFLDERFDTDFLKAGIGSPSIYGSFNGPLASYTTLNLLMWECLRNPVERGGAHMLVSTLEDAYKKNGGEVVLGSGVGQLLLDDHNRVEGVVLENGDQFLSRVVLSSCHPKTTFFDFLPPNVVPHSLEHHIQHYRTRGTTSKIHLAINGPVHFKGLNGQTIERARTSDSFINMQKAFDPIKYDEYTRDPILDIYVPSIRDESLAPHGHNVISVMAHFYPYKPEGGWTNKEREILENSVITKLSHYIEDLKSLIVGSEVLTPLDIEEKYNLPGGHIFHGEHAIDQILTRPIPDCSRYTTPIQNLYLCGSGSFPGGGISCAPGYLSAEHLDRILK